MAAARIKSIRLRTDSSPISPQSVKIVRSNGKLKRRRGKYRSRYIVGWQGGPQRYPAYFISKRPCSFDRLLILIVLLAFKIAPREKKEDIKVHGAGQIGLLQPSRCSGWTISPRSTMDEPMMSALHPYGLQNWGFLGAGIISSPASSLA